MRIVMATNTFRPHVGGVANSVVRFSDGLRSLGHQVLTIAPEFAGAVDDPTVIRVPAIQNFNGSDFSVRLPVPPDAIARVEEFEPDIIHSHHPFLLGDTALRIASLLGKPLVFTHHTMYERYTHYVPGDSPALQQFVIQLATGYANLCQQVIAPSESVAQVLRERGVETAVDVIPTGIELPPENDKSASAPIRSSLGIPPKAFLVGHVGRLAPEKNLAFMTRAVLRFMRARSDAHFLLVGDGPSREAIERRFSKAGMRDRLHATGTLEGEALLDAYRAMDVFVFASLSETQGMVVTEAMSLSVPVVALDAPGVREVVEDKHNGRLLVRHCDRAFSAALEWLAGLPPERYERLRRAARRTAEDTSIERCTERLVEVYSALQPQRAPSASIEDSSWSAAHKLIENEWQLAAATAQAVGHAAASFLPRRLLRAVPRLIKGLRKRVNRAELALRLLKLPERRRSVDKGLVLIQIDGLARSRFEQSSRYRQMPFLRRLLNREGYTIHDLYSGLPSSTPAVQGEILYGVRTAVPAFSFFRNRRHFAMFGPQSAREIEDGLLATGGEPLLTDGSAYSLVYGGGARECRFCPSQFGWGEVFDAIHPLSLAALVVFHLWSLIRVGVLMAVELVLACIDVVRGAISGKDLWTEIKFVPTRVGISVGLRELLVIGARLDLLRGFPIIYLNFLGYDEQAHRRGPDSRFALWTLSGIDDAIKRIWSAAISSPARRYDVWVFSDHGQERTVPYHRENGRTITASLEAALGCRCENERTWSRSAEEERAQWVKRPKRVRAGGRSGLADTPPDAIGRSFALTAMGPVAHVYFDCQDDAERRRTAAAIVSECRVPLVCFVLSDNVIYAHDPDGCGPLHSRVEALAGPNHPFLRELPDDLSRLIRHPDAGSFVLFGWRRNALPLTFAIEHGSHGGPGPNETHAFALLPPSVSAAFEGFDYLRPGDLRDAILARPGVRTAPSADEGEAASTRRKVASG